MKYKIAGRSACCAATRKRRLGPTRARIETTTGAMVWSGFIIRSSGYGDSMNMFWAHVNEAHPAMDGGFFFLRADLRGVVESAHGRLVLGTSLPGFMTNDEIQVRIQAILPAPQGVGIYLGDGEKVIAIFVDPIVASAIALYSSGVKMPRPLTHDLIVNILLGMGATLERVVINDLQENTFYARLYLKQENEIGTRWVEIDSRPSDAMAMALRLGCAIHVKRHVWEQAEDMTWALEQAKDEADGKPGGPAEDGEGTDETAGGEEHQS